MYPTLKPGSVMIYDTQHYTEQPVRPGDVVLLKWRGETWVKRVYGVSGRTFWAFQERLEGEERYTPIDTESRIQFETLAKGLHEDGQFAQVVQVRVRPGHVFVLGDGSSSNDSSSMGQIPISQIIGRVVETPWQSLHRNPADSEWTFPQRGGRAY
jgi:signal peptidase I